MNGNVRDWQKKKCGLFKNYFCEHSEALTTDILIICTKKIIFLAK